MEEILSVAELHAMVAEDLGLPGEDAAHEKPLDLELRPPLNESRFYCFNLCRSKGRAAGEFKIMLALSGRRQFDFGGKQVFVLGYNTLYGVYALWDADLYRSFTYNRSLYVHEGHLLEARRLGVTTFARDIRKPHNTVEEVVIATRANIREALKLRRQLTAHRIINEVRR